MPSVFLHMGYPKCLSTTIQRSFFEKHPEVAFGGVGIEDNISYANNDIEFCFESLLKYANDAFWEKEKKSARQAIHRFITDSKCDKIIFSTEHLSMNFTLQGIDSVEKLRRVRYLVAGFPIQILLIKRAIPELLKSLYKELVKMGYANSYKDFLKWLLVFKDRNFLADLNFKCKAAQIAQYLPEATVTWLDFSEIRKGGFGNSVNEGLSKWLNVSNLQLEIHNDNPSLSDEDIDKLRKINSEEFSGCSQLNPFEQHRNRILYTSSGLEIAEEEIFSNVLKKRAAIRKIRQIGSKNVQRNNYEQKELMISITEAINSFDNGI